MADDYSTLKNHSLVANQRNPLVKIGICLLSIFAITGIGFIVGIIPGLFLGFLGLNKLGAIVIAIIWGFGYIRQRHKNYGFVDWISFCIAGFGGIGVAIGVWVLGNITFSD